VATSKKRTTRARLKVRGSGSDRVSKVRVRASRASIMVRVSNSN